MLAGVLFAIDEAAGASPRLVATLPFAGTTVIEHQARQLLAAGAAQLVVIAPRATPELLGAVHRIGRRGIAVDAVRGVAEASALLHPLSRVVIVADGLVAVDAVVAGIAAAEGETLLVVPADEAPARFERLGGGAAWAGLARLDPRRVAEAAALPADYDPASTLLRVAEAAGAVRVALPARALAEGHGLYDEPLALDRIGRRVVAGAVAARFGWFDRLVAGPLARVAVPPLIAGGASGSIAGGLAALLALAACALLLAGWWRSGLVLAIVAMLGARLAETLATVREEPAVAVVARHGAVAIPLAALALLGYAVSARTGDGGALVLAVALVVAALLGERAARRRGGWWGSPPAYALVVLAAALPGWPVAGLAIAALYAAATLAAAIEALRRQA